MVAEPGSAPAGVNVPTPGTPGRPEGDGAGEAPRGQRRRLGDDAGDAMSMREMQNQIQEMGSTVSSLAQMMQNLMQSVPGPSQGPRVRTPNVGERSGTSSAGPGVSDAWASYSRANTSVPPFPPGMSEGGRRPPFYGQGGASSHGDRPKVLLEEKHFRRIDQFSGDAQVFRSWLFDLLVSIGWVDGELSGLLEEIGRAHV